MSDKIAAVKSAARPKCFETKQTNLIIFGNVFTTLHPFTIRPEARAGPFCGSHVHLGFGNWFNIVGLGFLSGSGISASGTFTTDETPDANGGYLITAISGARNGVNISGLQSSGNLDPGKRNLSLSMTWCFSAQDPSSPATGSGSPLQTEISLTLSMPISCRHLNISSSSRPPVHRRRDRTRRYRVACSILCHPCHNAGACHVCARFRRIHVGVPSIALEAALVRRFSVLRGLRKVRHRRLGPLR